MRCKKKTATWAVFSGRVEGEGFEPPEPRGSTVFKTAAIDHSAIPLDDDRAANIANGGFLASYSFVKRRLRSFSMST